MKCPKCGFNQVEGDSCVSCGIIFSRFYMQQLKELEKKKAEAEELQNQPNNPMEDTRSDDQSNARATIEQTTPPKLPVNAIAGSEAEPSPAALDPITASHPAERTLRVVVTDVDMPFRSMISFMVKWSLASIPAFIILAGIGIALGMILFSFFGALVAMGLSK